MHETRISDWIITSSDVAAAAAVASALVLIAAAVIAWRQVGEARRLRVEQVAEARRQHLAQIRPFVVVDLHVKGQRISLVVENIGPVQARDVRLTFDPPMRSSLDDSGPICFADLKVLREGVDYLAPGTRHSLLWDFAFRRFEDNGQPKEGFDLRHVVKVRYRSGLEGDERLFEEETALDLGLYVNTRTGHNEDIADVYTQVKAIAETLKKWTFTMPNGVRVVTGMELERRDRRWAEEQRMRELDDGDEAT